MLLNEIISKYASFIFDFDGVIVDSVNIKADAFMELFKDLGPEVMQKVRQHHLHNGGVSRYEKFKIYYRQFRGREITSQESSALDKQYSDLVVQKVIKAPTIPGVMEFLSRIKTDNKFCCVISATPQEEIRHIVMERQMAGFFKEVLGSPKPKKENVALLLKKHRLSAAQTVYFGDAKSDYEAARDHGIHFIGLSHDEGELSGIPGVMQIRNFIDA